MMSCAILAQKGIAMHDRDKNAVFALLVRQVEAQAAGATAQKDLDDAKKRLAAATQASTSIRNALGIFGFDMSIDKPWDLVRDAIGNKLFSDAIRIGNGEPVEAVPAKSEPPDDDEEYVPPDGEPEKPIPSNIRDLVMEQLRQAGDAGIKVAPIKDYIAAKGIEMHEKTVGMTLYRLSKDGFARRDGRTWFFVPLKEETKNPDAGASGLFGD
jgi:hypothetical protein